MSDIEDTSDKVSKNTLILSVIGTIITVIVILESMGMIIHNSDKDSYTIGTYRALMLDAAGERRASPKPSGQYARCEGGYVILVPDETPNMQGLLVDYKDRAIRCNPAVE